MEVSKYWSAAAYFDIMYLSVQFNINYKTWLFWASYFKTEYSLTYLYKSCRMDWVELWDQIKSPS